VTLLLAPFLLCITLLILLLLLLLAWGQLLWLRL
jgi:hypothetical protein